MPKIEADKRRLTPAPSLNPRLPEPVPYTDDDLVVSFSELDSYRQCPLKHFLGYRQRWTKPTTDDSPLTKGTLWHNVMEDHYNTLMEFQQKNRGRQLGPVQQIRALAEARKRVQKWFRDGTADQTPLQELVEWMYDGYVEKYGADPQWKILGVEYRAAAYLPDPLGIRGDRPIIIKAKLDLVVMDYTTRQVWIIDHKSGANLPNQMDLEIDDQFGLYTWFMKIEGLAVTGSIHNAARTTRNKADWPDYDGPKSNKPQTLEQRMHRSYLNRGDLELENIAQDAAMVSYHIHPVEGAVVPLYSAPDPRSCGWKCDFKEVHLLARAGRNLNEVLPEYGFAQDFTRH